MRPKSKKISLKISKTKGKNIQKEITKNTLNKEEKNFGFFHVEPISSFLCSSEQFRFVIELREKSNACYQLIQKKLLKMRMPQWKININ